VIARRQLSGACGSLRFCGKRGNTHSFPRGQKRRPLPRSVAELRKASPATNAHAMGVGRAIAPYAGLAHWRRRPGGCATQCTIGPGPNRAVRRGAPAAHGACFVRPSRLSCTILEVEQDRWFLWLPVLFGAGIALYFSPAGRADDLVAVLPLVAALALHAVARRQGPGVLITAGLLALALRRGGCQAAHGSRAGAGAAATDRPCRGDGFRRADRAASGARPAHHRSAWRRSRR
jgi:hypothetical protein